jgi:hypothetical protein
VSRRKTVQEEAKANKPESPDEILAASRKCASDPGKFARAERRTAAAMRSERFEWNRSKSTVDGRLMHYFRLRGESITGVLGKPSYESWKGVSYPIVLDDGTVVRLPGNRQLIKLIETADCVHQRITITYLGKRYLTSRHYEKVYRIAPAPLGKDGVGQTGRRIVEQAAAEAKRRKTK